MCQSHSVAFNIVDTCSAWETFAVTIANFVFEILNWKIQIWNHKDISEPNYALIAYYHFFPPIIQGLDFQKSRSIQNYQCLQYVVLPVSFEGIPDSDRMTDKRHNDSDRTDRQEAQWLNDCMCWTRTFQFVLLSQKSSHDHSVATIQPPDWWPGP